MIKKEIILEKSVKIVDILQDFGFSFNNVNKLIRNKDIRVNGKIAKMDDYAEVGDKLTFFFTKQMLSNRFKVIFEDDDVVLIYKYAGIESQGLIEEVLSANAVHRLDRNTEGLIIYAKNKTSEKILLNAIKNHLIHKFYLTEVVGRFDVDKTFKGYLVKDSEKALCKIYEHKVAGGVKIETKIKTIKAGSESSLLEVELITGRTHQIRAHLAYLSHPIIGDGKYGREQVNKKFHASKQKLACYKLKFGDINIKNLNNKEFIIEPDWFNFRNNI